MRISVPPAKFAARFLFVTLLFCLPALAQDYTSIVVFGDSLSDTGNVTYLTTEKYALPIPGPLTSDYTLGRFTDGTDTVPAAHNYIGVWVEQLAALLPNKPPVTYSLVGGKDYAYGGAKAGLGTTPLTFGTGGVLSVNVNNVGQQVTDYLATSPKITQKTLFVVWIGANDVLQATSLADVGAAAIQEIDAIERLIGAGARNIIVPNLPPLGLIPRFNSSPAMSVPMTKAAQLYNERLLAGLVYLAYENVHKPLTIYPLDVFTLFKQITNKPSKYGFADVTASSQGNYLVNPDTYLFWDDLHPTTHGHNILALKAANLIGVGATASSEELPAADEVTVPQ